MNLLLTIRYVFVPLVFVFVTSGLCRSAEMKCLSQDNNFRFNIVISNDTLLKGNYRLFVKQGVDDKYLILNRGKFYKKISTCSKKLPNQNLGYLLKDFAKVFILAKSYGSGNPIQIELIRKYDGRSLLENEAIWISSSPSKENFFYVLWSEDYYKLVKMSATTYSRNVFRLPTAVTNQEGWFYLTQVEEDKDGKISISILESGTKKNYKIE